MNFNRFEVSANEFVDAYGPDVAVPRGELTEPDGDFRDRLAGRMAHQSL
jgi:hypothetical protein